MDKPKFATIVCPVQLKKATILVGVDLTLQGYIVLIDPILLDDSPGDIVLDNNDYEKLNDLRRYRCATSDLLYVISDGYPPTGFIVDCINTAITNNREVIISNKHVKPISEKVDNDKPVEQTQCVTSMGNMLSC